MRWENLYLSFSSLSTQFQSKIVFFFVVHLSGFGKLIKGGYARNLTRHFFFIIKNLIGEAFNYGI